MQCMLHQVLPPRTRTAISRSAGAPACQAAQCIHAEQRHSSRHMPFQLKWAQLVIPTSSMIAMATCLEICDVVHKNDGLGTIDVAGQHFAGNGLAPDVPQLHGKHVGHERGCHMVRSSADTHCS